MVFNNESGTVKVKGGTISNSSDEYSCGISSGSGIVEISGGTVSSSSKGDNTYGINNSDKGTTIIGIKGDNII